MTFVLRRAGQAAIVLIAAFTATFFLLQLLPGDAILIKFSDPGLGLSPEQLDDIRATYGADVPWGEQYLHAGLGFLAGDFGYSTQYGTPVRTMLAEALPATLLLAALGLLVAVLLAVLIAVLSSLALFAWLRDGLRQVPGLFVAVPVFWLGILLIQVFSFGLGWVPIVGADPISGLILPVLTLAVPISAPLAQVLVRSIDRVQAQPFVTVVRAKGAPPAWVLTRSVSRNAAVPTLTIAGVLFGELVGGAVVTETVFGRTGIGRLTEQAVANQDIPVLQGVVLLSALGFVVISFAVDLATPLIDPRQRRAARAARSRPVRPTAQEVPA
ncbi:MULTISPECIES: ABC transporter permease [unclassified Microbacterium]|uniref:ABC transporter permease n=1 Tax=unclassified Microbacterium TaxID=2609290 RepID=UPI0024682942|nr:MULTISPECIES: ABC transporter permease [unclassified Microbacterium]MDH5134827.1 ABC transporter permease [Microbacterium sp. RD10]MDH5138385.1 ABC transporter permease [Microbacterium sp. RD11]MDH5144644.1 ABC transporter permease [Microbacterium sp. RD12]MDH5154659.1 ABC transporter permease [Microbacterium sp. RD06]MDH5167728.1 ABC transporter permease [Microbacterium sp. RD02]